MRVRLWGVRGSIPVPGAAAAGYGGNTSCVQITTDDGTEVILDAGSGIRELGQALMGRSRRMDILLTHLHLDHIRGLMFFAPLFDPDVEATVWGPPAAGRALRERLARYISNPLSPIDIRELPARVTFRDALPASWQIGGVEVAASLVAHRGPTLGYRLQADGASLCYLPDHEPGLGQNLLSSDVAWISGYGLARGASLLIHDCQYTDDEYRKHRGWGHSSVSDALAFARRSDPQRVQLFHHDPAHDDARLGAVAKEALERWQQLGGEAAIELAREGRVITLAG
jgi:phosphoribosyl 1,2-cyclic phosphodiesterase